MKYLVTGKVQPERADINFAAVTLSPDGGGSVVASCSSSQLTIVLDMPEVDGWISAFVTAEHVGHFVVGALGFALGSGYSVDLIQVTEEDGTPHVFGVRPTGGNPPADLGFNPSDPVFDRALKFAAENIFFRLALRDYLRALTESNDCATYCYRAIESVKSGFAYKAGRDSWEPMHSALGTDRQIIEDKVKKYADPVRHGNWIAVPSTDSATRWEMISYTRGVLKAFLDHERPAL